MKFINTKRLSPVIYENDLPHRFDLFHKPYKQVPSSEKEYTNYVRKNNIITDDLWWDEQKRRCLEGYTAKDILRNGGDCFVDGRDVIKHKDGSREIPHLGVIIKGDDLWIPGRMYFYLNFWKIKRLDKVIKRKRVFNPAFTDLSYENWMLRELRTKLMKHMLWAKRRQVGLSEETACDLAYDFLFFDDSQLVIVAGQESYAKNTMRNVIRGLEVMKNTQFYKQLDIGGDSIDYIKSKYTDSEIHMRTAKDNPQVCSSLTPSKVAFEEVGKWKKGLVIETKEFIESSIEAEGFKTGVFDFIGTAGEEMKESVDDMAKMFYDPDSYNIMAFENKYDSDVSKDEKVAYFIPAWKFEELDDDFNSLRMKSEEKIMAERNRRKGKAKFIYTAMKPLTPSEMFQTSAGGYFGEEIIQYLNERYAYIKSHASEQITRLGVLKWKDPMNMNAGVDFEDDPNGWIEILTEPLKTKNNENIVNLYGAGTDSYDRDTADSSGSKGCTVIKQRFLNMQTPYNIYTAILILRPSPEEGGARLFYERSAMACIYFNFAKNNIEYSNLRIFDWYEDRGLQYLLKERPQIAFSGKIKNSVQNNRYGTDASLKPHALAILKDTLTKENIDNMYFLLQIQALAKFKYDPGGKKYNCDITMATAECEVCIKDEENIVVYEEKKEEEKKNIMVYRMVNGQLKSVFV